MVSSLWLAATGFSGLASGLFFCLGWLYFYAFGKYDPLSPWLGVAAHSLLLITLAGWYALFAKQTRLAGPVCGVAAVGSALIVLTAIPTLALLSTVRADQIAVEVEPVAPFVGGGPALLAFRTERPATPPVVDAVADGAGVLSLLGLAGCGALIASTPSVLPGRAGLLLLGTCALALLAFFNNPVLNTVTGVAFGVPLLWMGQHLLSDGTKSTA